MGKIEAMALMGSDAPVNHSIITGEIPTGNPNPGTVNEQAQNTIVKDVLDSDRYALMAKKEAKFVREREEFKKEQLKLQDEKTRLTEFHTKIQEFETLRKSDPVAALKHIGFSETEIFNYLANDEKKEPTTEELASKAAKEAIDNFKKEQLEIQTEAQKSRDTQIIGKFKSQISESITRNPDKYEYCAFNGPMAQELAFDLVNQVLKDSKGTELLTVEQALDDIELYYEEQDKAMSVLKKRQPKVEAPSNVVKSEPERTRTVTPPQQANPPAKTITNRMGATTASTIKRTESFEQKKIRLIEALKRGKL